MTTALVLSGGGSKGSFEVGALEYLYENGFLATVICSTSVGSVNAIQLAHGGTAESQRAAFDRLKTIWQTELTFNEDMYVEAAWLQGVTPRTRAAIVDLFSSNVNLPRLLSEVVFFPPYAIGEAVALGVNLGEGLSGLLNASSVYTLDPIRAKLAQYLNRPAVANSGVELRLVAVSLDSGAVRYITQDGRVIETDGRPVAGPNPMVCADEQAAYNAAIAARNAAQLEVLEARGGETPRPDLGQAQQELKRANAELADAHRRLDQCIASSVAAGTANRLVVDVADGVIASATIPCAFPPVILGSESYVDGGVRWVLPLKAALDFDADTIVAINASPAGVPPPTKSYRNANLLDIAERTVLDILLWETQERHLEAARLKAIESKRRVCVITPRVEVHDTLTIDPGLIDINIGYGWMRAADVMAAFALTAGMPPVDLRIMQPAIPVPQMAPANGPLMPQGPLPPITRPGGVPLPPQAQAPAAGQFVEEANNSVHAALADAIARCRRRCWEIEHDVFGMRLGETPFSPPSEVVRKPNPGALDQVRLYKSVLGLLVAARQEVNGKLPTSAAAWADNWERHRWAPSDVAGVGNTPWDGFVGVEDRAAQTRPTAMVVKAPGRDEVYLLTPYKCWIRTPQALAQVLAGRGFDAVTEIPGEYLDAFPNGNDINVV